MLVQPAAVIGSTFWALQPRDAFDSFSGSVSLALVWFQFTFATICATILLGAVSERATFVASIFSMVVVGGLAFPTVSHWLWSEYGWLSYGKLSGRLFGSGAFDLAGSGVVHVTGGAAALIAVILVGPRVGRYDEATRDSFSAHNVTLVCQVCLCWLGEGVPWRGEGGGVRGEGKEWPVPDGEGEVRFGRARRLNSLATGRDEWGGDRHTDGNLFFFGRPIVLVCATRPLSALHSVRRLLP